MLSDLPTNQPDPTPPHQCGQMFTKLWDNCQLHHRHQHHRRTWQQQKRHGNLHSHQKFCWQPPELNSNHCTNGSSLLVRGEVFILCFEGDILASIVLSYNLEVAAEYLGSRGTDSSGTHGKNYTFSMHMLLSNELVTSWSDTIIQHDDNTSHSDVHLKCNETCSRTSATLVVLPRCHLSPSWHYQCCHTIVCASVTLSMLPHTVTHSQRARYHCSATLPKCHTIKVSHFIDACNAF